MSKKEWCKNLDEELSKIIDKACEYIGRTELTKEEIRHWFLPLIDNLREVKNELFMFQLPESIEKEKEKTDD